MSEVPAEFSAEAEHEQQLRKTTHDLRNCLYVIQQGVELLDAFRGDALQFQTTLDLLRKEQVQAYALIDAIASLARSRPAAE